jgi:hypothetical protein
VARAGKFKDRQANWFPKKEGKFFLMMRSTERMIDNTAQIRF